MAREIKQLADQLNFISLRCVDASALLCGQQYIVPEERPGEKPTQDKCEQALRLMFEDVR